MCAINITLFISDNNIDLLTLYINKAGGFYLIDFYLCVLLLFLRREASPYEKI